VIAGFKPRKRQGGPKVKLVSKCRWLEPVAENAAEKQLPTLANAMLALRLDPSLENAFAYDEMLQPPADALIKPSRSIFSPRLSRRDVTELQVMVADRRTAEHQQGEAHGAVISAPANAPSIPSATTSVASYGSDSRLRWLAAEYLGVERNDIHPRSAPCFLIAMVAASSSRMQV